MPSHSSEWKQKTINGWLKGKLDDKNMEYLLKLYKRGEI